MYRISYKEMKNGNNHKGALKDENKDIKFQNQLKINQFNIIELDEEEEIDIGNEADLVNFSQKEIQRIIKKSNAIEEYYSRKLDDTKINENCFNCLMSDFMPNELLYFSKRKDLLIYLKYCFYFKRKVMFLDNHIYRRNKFDLDKCDTNYLN